MTYIYHRQFQATIATAHSWCSSHSTNINVCGTGGGKGRGSSFQKGALHTHTLKLD